MDEHSEKLVENAFQHDHNLKTRVLHAARHFEHGIPELLRDISTFMLSSTKEPGESLHQKNHNEAPEEPTAKKRKLEQTAEAEARSMGYESTSGSYEMPNPPVVDFECKDVSFTSPLRKKLKLQFVHGNINISQRQIRLLNQATGAVEYTLRGEDVDCMFCLPVPEKAQRQQCFVVFPLPGSQSYDGTPAEPLVWTMNETKGSPETFGISTRLHGSEEDTFVDVTRRDLDQFMASLSKKTILPSEREFASEIPQSHRKGEKAFHTKAFRGSKEGYLFLTSHGLVFGFKKPVTFFPFHAIESISFTSVLQRTFNIVITTNDPSDPEKRTEHELSMVDQADFAPIDTYIRAHGLNDASMAAERRAKIHNVNKPAEGEEANGDGRTEIQKAEEEAQDLEDEEEEDYDPSGGESEGSGEDSDEEEDGEGGGYEDGEEEWDEDEEVEPEEGTTAN